MRNYIFFTLFLCLFCFTISSSQTREIDYNYILNHYSSDEMNPNYRTKELTSSSIKKNNEIIASLKFVSFITNDDNKNRGMAIIYKEKKNSNEIVQTLVFCFPEKNSDNQINNKAVLALNAIKDTFILKYIISGFIKIGINY